MYTVSVCRQGEPLFVLDFDKPEITIGRGRDNDIVLPHGTVSRRHARIMVRSGTFFVVDDGSSNGTFVLGQKINTVQALEANQTVYCGIFSIDVRQVAQRRRPSRFADPMPPSPVSPTDRTMPAAHYPPGVDHTGRTFGPGELNVSDLQAAMAARGQQPQPERRPDPPPSEPSWRSEPSRRPVSSRRTESSSRSEPSPSPRPSQRPEPSRRSEPARSSERSRPSEPSWRSEPAQEAPPARSTRRPPEDDRGPAPNLDPEPMPVHATARPPAPPSASHGGIPAPQFDEVAGPSVMRGPGDR